MTDVLRVTLGQLNPTVGDLPGNAAKLREARAHAAQAGADVLVLPELFLSGYPPEDLVLRPGFIAEAKHTLETLAGETADGGPAVVVGLPWADGGQVFNAAAVLDAGEIKTLRFKHHLPNYSVFDEKRVFAAGPSPGPVTIRGVRVGLMVCEDMWFDDVAETLVESGAELLMVINGSPYDSEKTNERLNQAVARVTETKLPLIYVNQMAGQDDLVFDGGSFVLNSDCQLAVQAPWWQEAQPTVTLTRNETWACAPEALAQEPDRLAHLYQAMILGLRDYVTKSGFPGVVLGLSGGIDSALTAAVAVDALGADKVHCVMMPSPYTSQDSLEDAAGVADMTGASLRSLSIDPAIAAFSDTLAGDFKDMAADETEENIQSRSRGLLLMALSNKFGWMVVSTGNKSEMSVGYATLYGDMCGGYSVLKDVYKTAVFEVSRWRNAHKPEGALGPEGPVMPERVITKPPTAELKPDQTDQDSLPPYEDLDAILHGLIEERRSIAEIASDGFERGLVERVWRLLRNAEYKRRQAPPGVKLTQVAFGRDRRYPIVNKYTGSPT